MRPDTWRDHGACNGTPDLDLLFEPELFAEGRERFCNPCPVRVACLRSSLDPLSPDYDLDEGLRGGQSPKERRALAKGKKPPRRKRNYVAVIKKKPAKSSDYRGVSWASDKSQWRVQIRLSDGYSHFGYFPDTPDGERAAAECYDQVIIENFGVNPKGRRLNFPEKVMSHA